MHFYYNCFFLTLLRCKTESYKVVCTFQTKVVYLLFNFDFVVCVNLIFICRFMLLN